jgi:hypothetical protein
MLAYGRGSMRFKLIGDSLFLIAFLLLLIAFLPALFLSPRLKGFTGDALYLLSGLKLSL